MDVNIIVIIKVTIYSIIPGCAGGIACFLLMLKKGQVENNKYIAKFFTEVFGALITAPILTVSFFTASFAQMFINEFGYHLVIPTAFALGVAWSNIIQIIRTRVTKICEFSWRKTEKSESK